MAKVLNDIYHAGILEVVAACLSRKYGVQVTIGGTLATTQEQGGKYTITIPDLKYDDNLVKMVRAYIDHEAAHARFTDFNAVEAVRKNLYQGQQYDWDMVTMAWNVVEDIYVEKLMCQAYPGCAVNLREGADTIYADADTKESYPTSFFDTYEHAICIALYKARYEAYKSPVLEKAYNAVVEWWNQAHPSSRYVQWLEMDFIPRVPGKNSGENVELGMELCNWLVKEARNGQRNNYNFGLSSHAVERSGLSGAIAKVVGGIRFRPLGVTRTPIQIARVGADSSDGVFDITYLPKNELDAAETASAVLRTRLHSLLQAYVARRRHVGYAGKLDTHLLHRVGVSNPRVFRSRVQHRALNTDVILLVDSSGSMSNSAALVSGCTYAAIRVLVALPSVRTSVFSFGGTQCIQIFAPGDRLTTRMRIRPNGGTPLLESAKHALSHFDYMSDRRRVMIVITDGMPNGSVENVRDVFTTAQTRLDVDVVGIGIKFADIYRIIPGARVITTLGEFPAALFETLQNIFLAA